MEEVLRRAELFDGLCDDEVSRLAAIARPRSLRAGEYLFLLGDNADKLYVVLKGSMDLCFPLSFGGVIKDITLESLPSGRTLGWSSFVKPYRFTLSARAAEATELIGFPRTELVRLFDAFPRIGYLFSHKLSEIIGRRLLNLQALWARELQRAVASGLGSAPAPSPAGAS
ncbi:MAG: Crp/Fnr family transcriptional regulator [Planctomycetes bacterium]|nr:Crp/Fnr family transcriptional regulator [Planctomycetota bacterium]